MIFYSVLNDVQNNRKELIDNMKEIFSFMKSQSKNQQLNQKFPQSQRFPVYYEMKDWKKESKIYENYTKYIIEKHKSADVDLFK